MDPATLVFICLFVAVYVAERAERIADRSQFLRALDHLDTRSQARSEATVRSVQEVSGLVRETQGKLTGIVTQVDTGGGAYIGAGVTAGGNFDGRDHAS